MMMFFNYKGVVYVEWVPRVNRSWLFSNALGRISGGSDQISGNLETGTFTKIMPQPTIAFWCPIGWPTAT